MCAPVGVAAPAGAFVDAAVFTVASSVSTVSCVSRQWLLYRRSSDGYPDQMGTAHLDLDDPQQPFEQVAAQIRSAIASGELTVGQRLKSIRALAQEYGVSTGTVQRALSALREEGLITSWQGRGAFVRGPADSRAESDEADAVLARLQDLETRVAALEDRLSG